MYRMLVSLVFVSLSIAPVPPYKPKPVPEDLKAMQGEWKLVYCVIQGEKVDPEHKDPTGPMRIKGDRMLNCFSFDCQLVLNDKRSPKTIDATGDENGRTRHIYGIYKIHGDIKTVCWNVAYRPARFEIEDQRDVLFVYRRKKP